MKAPVALGVRALRGGGVVVGISLDNDEPRLILSSFLATAAAGDRLAHEPYHVAFEMARAADGGASAEAVAAVTEGRNRQDELAAQGVAGILRTLEERGCEALVAALLLNRAGWVTDLLSYSLAYADHPPVAEGLAVREAFRFAFRQCGVAVTELDEKSLAERASQALGVGPAALNARLKDLGAVAGRPWRKEQKLACLAAWIALATPA